MGRQADIEPRWLVSLMCVWAVHQRAADNRHLGYPSQAAFLTVGRATTGHVDPTGFCAQDFTELERAMEDLKAAHLGQYMAMLMYYKPWGVEACRAEGWPFGCSVYYKRLHAGHKRVAASIDAMRDIRRAKDSIDFAAEVE